MSLERFHSKKIFEIIICGTHDLLEAKIVNKAEISSNKDTFVLQIRSKQRHM
jgi:hypothetical protein